MISGVSKVIVPVDDQERAKGSGPSRSDSTVERRRVAALAAAQHFGWSSLFEDPDGTRYALGQWP